MRPLARFVPLLFAGLFLAGCATTPRRAPGPRDDAKTAPPPAAPIPPSPSETLRIPQPLRPPPTEAPPPAPAPRVLSLYIDNTTTLRAAAVEQLAAAAAAELRRRGYDVRSTAVSRPATPLPAPFGPVLAAVRTTAGETTPPAALREATYLHPNSPRFVLVATLDPAPPPASAPAAPTLAKPTATSATGSAPPPGATLGAWLCDTADGRVWWHRRLAVPAGPLDAARAQKLAGEWLREFPRAATVHAKPAAGSSAASAAR